MSKRIPAASASLAAVLTAFFVTGTPVQAQNDPGSRALRYLQSQQRADGSDPGFSNYDGTEWYVMASAVAGYDPAAMTHGGASAIAYLGSNVAGATSDAGNTARLIEAVVTAGQDPTRFGTNNDNLITKLNAFYQASGNSAGAYGNGETATEALAIQALVAAGQAVSAQAISYLKGLQDSDGGWNYTSAHNAVAGSDTNSTAMALMALDATGDSTADASALAWLHTQQQGDAGFPYQGAGSDPVSSALVLQAIVGARQNPNGSLWTAGGQTPYGYLLKNQQADGGFLGYLGEDVFTTGQVVLGLLQQPFPVRGRYAAGAAPNAEQKATLNALGWVRSQQSPATGGIPGGFSPYDASEFYAIGAAAAGYDPATLKNCGPSIVDYLAANAAAASADGGNTGRLILSVVGAHRDPTSFGGVDLVAKLNGFNNGSGVYQAGSTQGQALAILGLVAAHQPVPANAVAALKNAQDSDGGWDYAMVKDDPNAATNYDTSDTNSTGFALMALAAAGDHAADAAALAWLRTQQQSDGGFPYQGSPTDTVSTALVIQALLAGFQDPASTRPDNGWSASGGTPYAALAGQQQTDGRFTGYSDLGTTVQVLAALERLPFPVWTPGSLTAFPAAACPTPAPTPTATPTPAPTPTAALPPAPPLAEAPVGPGAMPAFEASPSPSPATSASPSATPSPIPSASPSVSLTPVAPVPSGNPSRGLPPLLVYVVAAAAALLLVGGGGGAALWLRRR